MNRSRADMITRLVRAESHEERLPSGICPSCRMYIENCDCFDDDPDEPYEFGEDDAFMEEE